MAGNWLYNDGTKRFHWLVCGIGTWGRGLDLHRPGATLIPSTWLTGRVPKVRIRVSNTKQHRVKAEYSNHDI